MTHAVYTCDAPRQPLGPMVGGLRCESGSAVVLPKDTNKSLPVLLVVRGNSNTTVS